MQNQTGSTSNHYLYTGQQFDPSSGLYSLRARYYAPGVGRFLSQDTYAVNFSNPIELNRYGYTANNPVNASDPSGMFADTIGGYSNSLRMSSMLKIAQIFVSAVFTGMAVYSLIAHISAGGIVKDLPQEKTVEQLALVSQMRTQLEEYNRLRRLIQPTPQVAITLFPLLPTITIPTALATQQSSNVIVELGCGDFSNLIRIKKQYPNAEVIGYEADSSTQRAYRENYQAALALGVKVIFANYGAGIIPADMIIAIAPQPGSANNVVNAVMSGAKSSGTNVYIATSRVETTGEDIRASFESRGIMVPPLMIAPPLYPSDFLGPFADILSFTTTGQ